MPEYALTQNYLDLMVELPWSKSTKGNHILIEVLACFSPQKIASENNYHK